MRASILLLLALALFSACVARTNAANEPPGPVKHFVVLMLENRAFDHMLGWMKLENSRINGLNGSESNPWDFGSPSSRQIYVTKTPRDETPNPDHSINGTSTQIYGTPNPQPWDQPTMKGFVKSGRSYMGDANAATAMDAWLPEHVPIISSLAKNFVMFDDYYCSVPGPTHVNRLYFHSATSRGEGHNNILQMILGYPQKPVYQLLDEAGYDWRAYFGEVPDPLFFSYNRQVKFWDRYRLMHTFYKDLANGDLPTFSFLSPNYFSLGSLLANDQHPAHAVSAGELLMKELYEAMRASPLWEKSALLITYDEHGGFYDHAPPPSQGVPNPDGLNSNRPPFTFNRLGVRIPTLLISPWVDPQVVNEPPPFTRPTDSSRYDHTSFIASITRLWNLNGPLTKRDAWAAPWDHLLRARSTPRTDCPTTLPDIYQPAFERYKQLKRHRPEHLQPLNDLHVELLQLVNAVVGLDPNAVIDDLHTEEEGGTYAKRQIMHWIERNRLLSKSQKSH